jgi:hypothetical protein
MHTLLHAHEAGSATNLLDRDQDNHPLQPKTPDQIIIKTQTVTELMKLTQTRSK